VPLTSVRNSLAMSLPPVKHSEMAKVSFNGVFDNGDEFLTGINNTGGPAEEDSNVSRKFELSEKFLAIFIGTRRSSLTKNWRLKNLVFLPLNGQQF
jgi:hypothetical protein